MADSSKGILFAGPFSLMKGTYGHLNFQFYDPNRNYYRNVQSFITIANLILLIIKFRLGADC